MSTLSLKTPEPCRSDANAPTVMTLDPDRQGQRIALVERAERIGILANPPQQLDIIRLSIHAHSMQHRPRALPMHFSGDRLNRRQRLVAAPQTAPETPKPLQISD